MPTPTSLVASKSTSRSGDHDPMLMAVATAGEEICEADVEVPTALVEAGRVVVDSKMAGAEALWVEGGEGMGT